MNWSLPEPRAQRDFVFTNVEAEGGWNEFKTECDLFINQSRTSEHQHLSSNGNNPSLASYKIISTLKPRSIYVGTTSDKLDYVSIFFPKEKPNKGGPLKQFYGLIYQQFTNTDQCIVRSSFQQPNLFRFNKITNSVFEFYYR